MKKICCLVLALMMVLGVCGAYAEAQPAAGMTAGTYTAQARGYVDMVTVETTVDGDAIVSVNVVEHNETMGIGTFAVDRMPGAIVAGQSVAVDVVSGATMTSRAVLNAVTAGLKEAGADVAAFSVPPEKPAPQDQELTTDVIIVGAGGAGLTAGVEASNNGQKVIVIEKLDTPGGNTIRSSGAFNVAGSPEQVEAQKGRFDQEAFITYTMEGGHDLNNPDLVRFMIESSPAIVEWLKEQGLNPVIGEGYGSYTTDNMAKGLILDLIARLESNGGEVMYGITATDLIMQDGAAVGILAEAKDGGKVTINAKSVIIASGGFGGDLEMCVRLKPELEGFVTDNSLAATGDGIFMAEAVGAALVDMEQIQSHPTIHQPSSTMLTEGTRTAGGILINTASKRFTNECTYRDVVSAAILAEEGSKACLVFDQGVVNSNANIQGYVTQGLIRPFDTIEEAAAAMGLDAAILKESVETWNGYVAEQKDPEFASSFNWVRDLSQAPYYAIWIAPGIHHTMGGIKINERSEVISTADAAIPGLFAAGEVTGGIHGGNRVGGNAILDILVFGRVAGESAAAYNQEK